MKIKKEIRIIERPLHYSDNVSLENHYSYHLYNSKSFFIRYYAYLPFIYSLKKIDISEYSHVLELGCADGPFLPTLNQYTKNMIAIDINEDSIRESKLLNKILKLKQINLLCSDGRALPFKDKSFDLIFCLEVLEHIKNIKQIVNEIYRILRKNGILICTIPIEIGPSLLIRTLLSKYLKFKRPTFTRKELFKNIFLKRTGKRTEYMGYMGHKNFDWRLVKKEIKRFFENLKIKFIPINILRGINPIVLIKAIKKD